MANAYGLRIGPQLPWYQGAPTFSTFTLNQSTDAVEWIFDAVEPATITRLGFRYGTRTGTPPTYRISLLGVDAAGNPDYADVRATATITPPASTAWDNTWQWVNLAASYGVTRGQSLAIAVYHESGTIDASNCSSFVTTLSAAGGTGSMQRPYSISNDAGARTRSVAPPCYGYGSSTLAYGRPAQSSSLTTLQVGTTPDEWGVKFSLPAWGSTYQVAGVRVVCVPQISAAGASLRLQLYDTDGTTVLQAVTVDTNLGSSNGLDGSYRYLFDEATLATLQFGSTYRIGLRADTANNQSFRSLTFAAAADKAAWPLGETWDQCTRTDDGAWTDTATALPMIDVLLADISGGGGGYRPSNWSGGFRG